MIKLQRLCTSKPFFSTVAIKPEFSTTIHEAIASADFIHASRLESLALVPQKFWKRTLLDLDECHVTLKKREQNLNPNQSFELETFVKNLDSHRIAYYQKQCIANVGMTFVCSEVERQRLGATPQISVIPNVANSFTTPPKLSLKATSNLLFVGNLSVPANIDAILYFVEHIWPRILNKKSSCELVIVGLNPSPQILQLANQNSIKLYANVPDLKPMYQNATVAIVPLRFGAGTKIKVLEAFGFGVPVVSTSIGAEGLSVYNGQHLIITDAPDEFADSCLQLLNEPETCRQLSVAAWEYFQAQHNPEMIYEKIAHALSQLSS
ncbi:MAG: glycosyltransferase [Microcoleaceae cyanobacterium]